MDSPEGELLSAKTTVYLLQSLPLHLSMFSTSLAVFLLANPYAKPVLLKNLAREQDRAHGKQRYQYAREAASRIELYSKLLAHFT